MKHHIKKAHDHLRKAHEALSKIHEAHEEKEERHGKRERITKHDREVDRRNLLKARKSHSKKR